MFLSRKTQSGPFKTSVQALVDLFLQSSLPNHLRLFLAHGYKVIFLYRNTSFRPFRRLINLNSLFSLEEEKQHELVTRVGENLKKYSQDLLEIPYVGLEEYLDKLK